MIRVIFLSCFLLSVCAGNLNGQMRSCGTFTYSQENETNNQRKDADFQWQQPLVTKANGVKTLSARSGEVYKIPVVFHVVYFEHDSFNQNISDELLLSQLDVLNQDFRRRNEDTALTRLIFKDVAADARIEFVLANRNQQLQPAVGITRTPTSVPFFTLNNRVKSSDNGGADPWNTQLFLNIWVCNLLNGEYLGYASFPGHNPAHDGVVLHYENVGYNPTFGTFFDLGRTCTHEVGHWLGLKHIWGDDEGACTGSDDINDTPNQSDHSSGCPIIQSSCGSVDMFENFMDYTVDGCVNMFTQDQVDLMRANLLTFRPLLPISPGFVAVDQPVNHPALQIFPNPANERINVEWNMTSAKPQFLCLKALNGQIVRLVTQPFVLNFAYTFTLSTLPPGLYILTCGWHDGEQHFKIARF